MKEQWIRVASWRVFAAATLCLSPSMTHAQRGSQGYVPQLYQGQEALREGKWNSAASHFRTALEWDRKGVGAHIGLGNVYLKTGQSKRAEEEFAAALRLKPHSAEAERGIHLARTEGQEESAFQALQLQVKNEPENADAHATYAEELLERSQVEAARKEALEALKLDKKQGHAFCALGRIAARESKDDQARTLLEQAVHYDGSDDDALMLLGDIAMRAKDYKQAVTYYRRNVRVVPDESEGHKKLMEALAALGDSRAAEKEKQTLARLGNQHP